MCALSVQQNAMKYIISYLIFISGIYYGEQRIGSAEKHVSPVHMKINTYPDLSEVDNHKWLEIYSKNSISE